MGKYEMIFYKFLMEATKFDLSVLLSQGSIIF